MIRLPLARLRRTQESTMLHECTVEPYTVGGDGTVTYGKAVTSVCGFDSHSDKLTGQEIYESVTAGASIRLPYGTAIGMKDRITLTKSFGTELTVPRTFEVVDFPDTFGPSGIQVEVREVFS